VASLARPAGKATGMAGMVPAAAKVAFIRRLLPQAGNLAVLYHGGDANSLLETENFRAAAGDVFRITDLPMARAEDLSALGELITPAIDAVFLPIGRVTEENFPTVAYYTDMAAIPVIASSGGNVPAGALGALVADHYKLGAACAGQAAKIFGGESPGLIPVGIVENPDILLNRSVAENLNIVLPADLIAAAREVFD
jgi:putative ABC transport system substrate-binding protein